MRKLDRCLPIAVFFFSGLLHSQNVGINANGAAPDASALLDIDGSALPANAQRGLLVPRVALSATNVAAPIAVPTTSLLIYNTATAGVSPNNVSPGYYYWDAVQWVRLAAANAAWSLFGNAGTTATANFIGTTDANAFVIKTGGSAATNERARVLAMGQVVVNNTGIRTGDVFSVYANNTTNGSTTSINNAAGASAVNGYASGNGMGVYGETNGGASTTGTAVMGYLYGTNTPTNALSKAVHGKNTTLAIGPFGAAIGVHGEATATVTPANGFVVGVYGSSAAQRATALACTGKANPVQLLRCSATTTILLSPARVLVCKGRRRVPVVQPVSVEPMWRPSSLRPLKARTVCMAPAQPLASRALWQVFAEM
ncbi:MAG TPA: hypothetical protein PK760_12835 [Flavobacteriales bacterium]|nr:hypothetical protein [Flavobacteriales bacterium]